MDSENFKTTIEFAKKNIECKEHSGRIYPTGAFSTHNKSFFKKQASL